MNRAIFSQVDFVREAHNTAVLQANLAGQAGVLVPAVETRYCSAEVLTTSFIPGLLHGPPSARGHLRAAAARTALTVVSLMVFRDGFVHCDLHPGNLYVRDDGSVVTTGRRLRGSDPATHPGPLARLLGRAGSG